MEAIEQDKILEENNEYHTVYIVVGIVIGIIVVLVVTKLIYDYYHSDLQNINHNNSLNEINNNFNNSNNQEVNSNNREVNSNIENVKDVPPLYNKSESSDVEYNMSDLRKIDFLNTNYLPGNKLNSGGIDQFTIKCNQDINFFCNLIKQDISIKRVEYFRYENQDKFIFVVNNLSYNEYYHRALMSEELINFRSQKTGELDDDYEFNNIKENDACHDLYKNTMQILSTQTGLKNTYKPESLYDVKIYAKKDLYNILKDNLVKLYYTQYVYQLESYSKNLDLINNSNDPINKDDLQTIIRNLKSGKIYFGTDMYVGMNAVMQSELLCGIPIKSRKEIYYIESEEQISLTDAEDWELKFLPEQKVLNFLKNKIENA